MRLEVPIRKVLAPVLLLGMPSSLRRARRYRPWSGGSESQSRRELGKRGAGQYLEQAPGPGIVAATAGEASVGDDGSASYTVPLWVPDGFRGLQPSLALEYNSEAGVGVLGPRWRISGLSSIVRCAKTRALDGVSAPLDFDGDAFCLDGQRLIRTSGAPNGLGQFRTERDPYARIDVTAANASAGGVQTFKVYQPDGRIFWYGRGWDSRLKGNLGIYGYYLDKIEDRFGNSLLVFYLNGGGTGSAARELVPAHIQYGHMGDTAPQTRSVLFTYEPLLANSSAQAAAEEARTSWIHGLGIIRHEYLKQIHMKGPGTAGTVVLKSYKFTYDPPPLFQTDRLLRTITECDGAGVCKKPTALQWEAGALDYPEIAHNRVDLYDQGFSLPIHQRFARIVVADLNDDGRDDVLVPSWWYGCVRWWYRLGVPDTAGARFGALIDLGRARPTRCSTTEDKPDPSDLLVADLNGDGHLDVIESTARGKYYTQGPDDWPSLHPQVFESFDGFKVGLSIGSLMFGPPIAFEDATAVDSNSPAAAIADIDGDGLPEILRPKKYSVRGVWAASIQASGTVVPKTIADNSSTGSGQFWAFDLDGDGTAEVLRDRSESPGGTSAPIVLAR